MRLACAACIVLCTLGIVYRGGNVNKVTMIARRKYFFEIGMGLLHVSVSPWRKTKRVQRAGGGSQGQQRGYYCASVYTV
jgi:hypothetical protein